MAAETALGTAYVEIRAKLDKLGADLNEARAQTAQALAGIQREVTASQGGLRGLETSLGAMRREFASAAKATGPLAVGIGATSAAFDLLARAGVQAIGMMAQFAGNTATVATGLVNASRQIGVGVEALQVYSFVAQRAGVQQVVLETGLQRLVKNVSNAKVGTGEFAAQMVHIDRSFLQAVKSARSVDDAIGLVIQRIADAPTQFEKATIATAAFGRSGVALIPFADSLREGTERAKELNLVLSGDLVAGGARLQDQAQELAATIRANLQRAFLELAPTIESASRKLADFLAASSSGRLASASGVKGDPAAAGLTNLATPPPAEVDASTQSIANLASVVSGLSPELQASAAASLDFGNALGSADPLAQALTTASVGLASAVRQATDAELEYQAAVERRAATVDAAIGDQASQIAVLRDAASANLGLAEAQRRVAEQKKVDAAVTQFDKAAQEALNKQEREVTDTLRGQDEARREASANRKKAAGEAEAEAKRSADQAKRAAEQTLDIENRSVLFRLDGVERVQEEYRQALAEQAQLLAEGAISEEDFARRRVAINLEAEQAITDARVDAERQRQQDAERARRDLEKSVRDAERLALEMGRAFVAASPGLGSAGAFFGLRREDLAKLFKGGQADAQAFADNLTDIMDAGFASVGALGRDALHDLFVQGEFDAEAFMDHFKSIVFDTLFDIAGQQIIIPIIAQLVGVSGIAGLGGGGGAAGTAGGGVGGALGLVQQGQQLLSLGQTLYQGFGALTGALGASTATTGMLAGDIAALQASGITVVGSGAPLTAAETSILFPNAATTGTGSFGTSGGAISGAASTAAILFAVVAAIETIGAAVAVGKARDTLFSHSDTAKVAEASFDPFTLAIGNALSYVFTGQKASTLFESQQRALYGGADVKDIVYTTILNILNPLNFAIGIAGKLPTKGTVLRKGFEEFLEKDGAAVGFFGRNSGTFARGIGQTGSLEHGGPEFLTPRQQAVIGGGTRGIQDEFPGLDFVEAQKLFIERQKESIGLSDKQLQQVTGLGAAFRAIVGGKAGTEEARTFGLIADFLGSITAEGAGAAETMDIVAEALASMGRPAVIFERLNQFFTSGDNDLAVETYRDAIQGLAGALFQDLPQGVDAAALALLELDKAGNGLVLFENIEARIKAAVVEAEALGPALAEAFRAGIRSVNLADFEASLADLDFDPVSIKARIDSLTFDPEQFGTDLFDSIRDGLKETIASAVFDGFIEGQFKGDILGPFLATFEDIKAKVKAKEITQAEANVLLADATADARDNLELLRPLLLEAIAAGKTLAEAFDDAGDSAEALLKLTAAFNRSIAEQTLGALAPDLADQYELEIANRQRLAAAKAAGGDITAVERLNGLLRAKLLKDQGEDALREQKRFADEQARLLKAAQEKATQALKGIKDAIDNAIGSTSSPLAPRVALANAQAKFDDLAAKAAGGDLQAAEDLPAAFATLNEVARAALASGPEYADIFATSLGRMQAILAAGPGPLTHIEPGDQLIVDALDENFAEANALLAALLDAFGLDAQGNEKNPTGPYSAPETGTSSSSAPGNPTNVGPDAGATGGQYGLGSAAQQRVQSTLAGLRPGGDTETALRLLLSAASMEDVRALAGVNNLQGQLAKEILADFPGATSLAGFDRVVGAYLGKILDPATFQPVLGFARGGITDRPAIFGEGGGYEAAIPLTGGRMIPIARIEMDLSRLARAIRDAGQPAVSPLVPALRDLLGAPLQVDGMEAAVQQLGFINARLENLEHLVVPLVAAADSIKRTQRQVAFSDGRGNR